MKITQIKLLLSICSYFILCKEIITKKDIQEKVFLRKIQNLNKTNLTNTTKHNNLENKQFIKLNSNEKSIKEKDLKVFVENNQTYNTNITDSISQIASNIDKIFIDNGILIQKNLVIKLDKNFIKNNYTENSKLVDNSFLPYKIKDAKYNPIVKADNLIINTIDMINALNAITFDVVLEISRLKRKIMIRGINNIPIFK